MIKFSVVIPARYASTRLPGKPLLDVAGTPMLIRTVRQARKSGADQVVVATDDARIESLCQQHDVDVVMTSADHQSGTDRMCEVAQQREWSDRHCVINVQGDEPFIPPDSILQVAELLQSDCAEIATLATPITSNQALNDPNTVKVVCTSEGHALYFSRSPIPYVRESNGVSPAESGSEPLRHIGIYGYRIQMLKAFAAAGSCGLERCEQLEQLRALWHGWPIRVGVARTVPGPGVDTAEDLDRACDYAATLEA